MHPEYRALTDNYYSILAAITVRDGFGCACCGAIKRIVVDHIVPVKRDGKTEIDNLQLLCNRCNNIKGGQVIDYRPLDRGSLGRIRPRYTTRNTLVIRVMHWERKDRFDTQYRYLDCEVLKFAAKRSVHVLLADGRRLNAQLRHVYPPDLQHLL